jgi:N-acetylmuramoyl-L-alanine amidase
MKTGTRAIAIFFIGMFSAAANLPVAFTLQVLPDTSLHAIGSMVRQGDLWIDAPQFFDRIGCVWQWDESVQQLSCAKDTVRYVFSPDVQQYSGPAGLSLMSEAPVYIGHSLYLPFQTLLEIVPSLSQGPVRWDTVRQILSVSRSTNTITSVIAEARGNGIVVTIGLNDPVRFECVYDHPGVIIDFSGATVDTARIVKIKKTGCLDSLSVVQTGESARLRLALSQEIVEPKIDYIEDQGIILVTLLPRQVESDTGKASRQESGAVLSTIVLDPGHGGKDPGAIGLGGTREKDVVLKIALHLYELFKQCKDIKVYLTRDRDIFVPLSDRTEMANRYKADLFVSIHANATSGSRKKKETTAGYKVYFLSQAKNEEDKLAAMLENAVIELEEKPQHYSALQNVLIELAGNEYQRESQELSILIDQRFEKVFKNTISRQATGIGQANFWVLNGAYMPSILIETGFISNRFEEKLLRSTPVQKRMAAAIYEALIDFIKQYGTGL